MALTKAFAAIGLTAVALTTLDAPPARADAESDRIAGRFVLTSSIPDTAPYRGVFRLAVSGQTGDQSLNWARGHASDTSFPAVGTSGPIVMDDQCLSTRGFRLAPCFSPDPAQRFGMRDAGDGALKITQTAAGGERTRVVGFNDFVKEWQDTETPDENTITTALGSELSPDARPVPKDADLPPIAQAYWDDIVASERGFSVRIRAEFDATVEALLDGQVIAEAASVNGKGTSYDLNLPLALAGQRLAIRTTAANGQTSESRMTVPETEHEVSLTSPEVTWTTKTTDGDFRVRGFAPTGATVMADSSAGAVAAGTAASGRFELTIPAAFAGQVLEYRSSLGTEMSAPSEHRLEVGGDGHIPTEVEAPRVTGVVHYLGDTMFIEGTVSYDPRQWASTFVTAYDSDGRVLATGKDFNGAFALSTPLQIEGQRVTLVTTIGDVESAPVPLVLTRSDNTAARSFPLDVVSPAADETVGSARPTFSGTGIPGSQVSIADGTARRDKVCSTTIGADGAWSCTPTVDLPEGAQAVQVLEKPFWNSITPIASTTSFVVDTESGVITPFSVTSPATNAVVDERRPTFTGTGQDGATVVVRGTTRVVATTTVVDGEWSVPADVDLADGGYALTATQSTTSGDTTQAPVAFRIAATVAPVKVVSPAAGATVTTGKPTFTGTGQDGATVVVRGTTRVVGTATVVGGKWTLTSEVSLGDGNYALTAVQTTTSGKESSAPITFTVDARTSPVKVVTPAAGSTVTAAKPKFTGTGHEGATISLRGTTRTPGTAVVQDGKWELTSEIALGNGEYLLSVDQTTAAGTSTVQHRFTVRA